MDRNIIEILVILMRQYPGGAISAEEYEPLTQDLIGQGFSQQEIETAMFWYQNRAETCSMNELPDNPRIGQESFRVLHDIERALIAPEAYGYLLELTQLGLISMFDMDSIINKLVLLGGRRFNLEDIKTFIAAQIIEQDVEFPSNGLSFYLKTPSDKIH